MFQTSSGDVKRILMDFGIRQEILSLEDLERYHYEKEDPASPYVRVIQRASLEDGSDIVIRYKWESDVNEEILCQQCAFQERLYERGVLVPRLFKSDGEYVRTYFFGKWEVLVTVEEYVPGEIDLVDLKTARDTGCLLAKTHQIAEEENLHVDNEVLFDPFEPNDLFDVEHFMSIGSSLSGEALALHWDIIELYQEHMNALEPLKQHPRYAVQGDISDCNLYRSEAGELGIFDFNRSGDNNLYCDAIMQAVFEARLMDYAPLEDSKSGADSKNAEGNNASSKNAEGNNASSKKAEGKDAEDKPQYPSEETLLRTFLEGYQEIRPFNKEEKAWFPHLYAIIDAFWASYVYWNEDSLIGLNEEGKMDQVVERLIVMREKLQHPGMEI